MDEYISIIITSFNAQQWLARCIDSVIAAADESCEIIIVDDGSTDESAAIAHEYETRDDRITCYAIEHGGLSAARKYGVESCNGDSVIFVDCDDTLPVNAIAEFRASSTDDCEIVCGNIVMHGMHGKKKLTRSGSFEVLTGTQFAIRTLSEGLYSSMVGKKFARYLFDVNDWDTDQSLSMLYQRVHLLHLACTANKVAIAPRAIVYNHIGRPNSMSSMYTLHLEGIERAWNSVHNLPLPSKALTQWGLDIIDSTLLQRGFPFPSDYAPAVELRQRARKLDLSQHHRNIVRLLGSERLRDTNARTNVTHGDLTINSPHISFIVPIYNNAGAFLRTVKSILATGLRNIEIIAVDDASDRKTSIQLSNITIRYPRILLHRHPAKFGIAQARRTGLNLAKGYAVLFVDAGDLIERDGVFKASMLIDGGVDLAYFGVKSRVWPSPFKRKYFVPSECEMLNAGPEERLYTYMQLGFFTTSLRAMAFNRSFLTVDLLCERGVKYGSGHLSLLRILMAQPRIGQTDAVGYINTHRQNLRKEKAKHRCFMEIDLSIRIYNIFKDNGLMNEYVATQIANGLIKSLTRTVAAELARPFKGERKARKLIRKILTWTNTDTLFELLALDHPHPDDILEDARKLVRAHRWQLLLGTQQNW